MSVVPRLASTAVMTSTVPTVAVQRAAGPVPARRGSPPASASTKTPVEGSAASISKAR